jgi:hypothetical protein
MLEGINRYETMYNRQCAVGNCIDFSGAKVNGYSTFSGMCGDNYCGMSQCKISFGMPDGFVTTVATTPTTFNLAQGPGSEFLMQRLAFNSKGELVPNENGIFAIFVYHVGPSQYLLCYKNNTPTPLGSVTKLFLQPVQTFDFPSFLVGYVSLFVLMETLTPALVPSPNPLMARKILVFYGQALSSDSQLLAEPYLTPLININGKAPQTVVTEGLAVVGGGIVVWDQVHGGYISSPSDYVTILNSTSGSSLLTLSQDVLENRLNFQANIPFYAWNTSSIPASLVL